MRTTRKTRDRSAFTVVELLVVVAIVAILLGLAGAAWLRARHTARVIAASAVIKSKLDDAIIRGAVKAKDYEFYRQQLQRQTKSGLDQKWSPG